jgi:hypothetical protein
LGKINVSDQPKHFEVIRLPVMWPAPDQPQLRYSPEAMARAVHGTPEQPVTFEHPETGEIYTPRNVRQLPDGRVVADLIRECEPKE